MDQLSPKNQTRKTYSVSEVLHEVQQLVEQEYRVVHIVGEISSFKPWRSGHWYFDLKDDKAAIPGVMFKALTSRVLFEIKDGLQVCVSGRLSVYAGQSKVQLIATAIEPLGQGALALAFEQLKKKLSDEGLFSSDRKKPLPAFPRRIGLVTSPQGAALQDMLRIFRQRMPKISILLAPARVQGEGSAQEIASALKQLDEQGDCDVIIVGRGGGSLEDLWSFNEEVVARQIAACKTPIVSAVGHETDFCIADFVADQRCATPTHAAQEVVPSLNDIVEQLASRQQQLRNSLRGHLERYKLALSSLAGRLPEPRLLVMRRSQQLDLLAGRLDRSMTRAFQIRSEKFRLLAAQLDALSPLKILSRGFATVNSKKKLITSVTQVKAGDLIQIRVADGDFSAHIKTINKYEK